MLPTKIVAMPEKLYPGVDEGEHVLSSQRNTEKKEKYKVLFDTFLICVVRQCQCLSQDLSPAPVENNDKSCRSCEIC